jgi:hypothetical protein
LTLSNRESAKEEQKRIAESVKEQEKEMHKCKRAEKKNCTCVKELLYCKRVVERICKKEISDVSIGPPL